MMTFRIKGIDHFVIGVHDLDKATETFTTALNTKASAQYEDSALGVRNVTLELGDAFMGLATPLSGDAGNNLRRWLEDGEGLVVLALEVDDIDVAVADLRAKGIQVPDPSSGGARPQRSTFFRKGDVHGIRIQLLEKI